jgi:hypothetical protein
MDVRMAVLQQALNGGKFYEGYLVAAVIQQVHCRRDDVWEALWGLVGDGPIYLVRKALEPIRARLPDGLADPVTLDAVG